MSDSLAATTVSTPAGSGDGLAPAHAGQADGLAKAGSVGTSRQDEQPTATAAPSDQPAHDAQGAESSVGWKSVQDAERDYKALQREYTRVAQAVKSLGDVNALKQSHALLGELSQNPEFMDWVKSQMTREQAGSNDPDTQKALDIVDQRARDIAQQMVAPLLQANIEQRAEKVFQQMDQTYGPDWQTLKPKMLEVYQRGVQAGLYSPQAEYNFDLDFVKGLYAAAAVADPAFVTKASQRLVAAKTANTTASTAGSSPASVSGAPIRNLRDAYAAAVRQHSS